jgi:mono/diheme cytochrome c family protein
MSSSRTFRSLLPTAALCVSAVVSVSVSIGASLGATGCAPDKMPFKDDEEHVFAGGQKVSGHELNLGYQSYMRYCYACHGPDGDGKGPASYGYRPPPRNFTQGAFKFARMMGADDVPQDDDLVRIVKGGLHGTPMLEWDVPEEELRRILQYIKTFNKAKWEKKKKNGDPVKTVADWEPKPDPWEGKDNEAVQRGRELYHFKAECVNCHPAYGTKKDLYDMSVAANKREPDIFKPMTGFRDDFYGSVAKDSSEYGVRLLPPDFTFNYVRSVREGHELEDLFRVLNYGVYPIMPAWQGALSDSDIWAIAHYVRSLMAKRGTSEALEMQAKFTAQAPFEVPAPKPEEPKPADQPAPDATADGGAPLAADGGAPAAPADKKDEKKGDKKKGDKKPKP